MIVLLASAELRYGAVLSVCLLFLSEAKLLAVASAAGVWKKDGRTTLVQKSCLSTFGENGI